MPKFEVYKHNDELFNIYYGIFYELWTSTDFDRLCKLEKRGDEIKKKSSPLKLLSQSQPNFAEMILRWSPFKIVSVSAVLYSRWPPLLKIEISSNGQNCSILSQKVPKFELYKHNDELFNIYYVIFYELWTFTDFDRLCKLEKRVDEIKKNLLLWKLLSQSQPNFAEMILEWSSSKFVSGISEHRPRLPSQPNLIKHRTLWEIPIKIFLSETICSIRTKFWWNSHWMVLFQKCVWRFDPSIHFFFTCNFEVNLITHLGVLALFSSNL